MRKPKKTEPNYKDGRMQGYVRGKLHAAVVIVGECMENAVLSSKQATRLNKAAKIINDVCSEVGQ